MSQSLLDERFRHNGQDLAHRVRSDELCPNIVLLSVVTFGRCSKLICIKCEVNKDVSTQCSRCHEYPWRGTYFCDEHAAHRETWANGEGVCDDCLRKERYENKKRAEEEKATHPLFIIQKQLKKEDSGNDHFCSDCQSETDSEQSTEESEELSATASSCEPF